MALQDISITSLLHLTFRFEFLGSKSSADSGNESLQQILQILVRKLISIIDSLPILTEKVKYLPRTGWQAFKLQSMDTTYCGTGFDFEWLYFLNHHQNQIKRNIRQGKYTETGAGPGDFKIPGLFINSSD